MSDKETLKKLVNDYVEPNGMLGWKESYTNLMEDIINGGTEYSEELQPMTEDDLVSMLDFWCNESLLKDYIKSGNIEDLGKGKGKITLCLEELK